MSINKNNYGEYVKRKTPGSPVWLNCLKAFLVGGAICAVGQGVHDLCAALGANDESVKTLTPVIMIFLGSLLTGVGVYDKLGKFAGGGSLIPITGFANSIVASAMEFKKEGFVTGVGAKMFTIAGPVIVYGTIASVIYGTVLYILKLCGVAA